VFSFLTQKSDASGSSDQLSSLSSAAGSNLTSPQYCHAVCLRHESPRDQPSNHYHKLSAQVGQTAPSRVALNRLIVH